MKKLMSVMLSVVLLLGLAAVSASGAPASAQVYVTISDGAGEIVMAQETVTVTDIDNDSKLTINDALYCAHEKSYAGGAAQGYATEMTQWGIGIKKLWGVAAFASDDEKGVVTVTLSIRCDTVAGKSENEYVPQDGTIIYYTLYPRISVPG